MIYGKQVKFRPMEQTDLEYVTAINDDPVVRSNVVGWSWPNSMASQNRWFASASGDVTHRWVILDDEDRLIGVTGLWDVDLRNRHALTALKLGGRHEARGRGLGTDSIKAAMAFAFYDVGLNRLFSSIISGNEASRKAYCDRCGWSVEGTARDHVWRHGEFVDLIHVGVLKSDFDKLPDAQDYIDLIKNGRA